MGEKDLAVETEVEAHSAGGRKSASDKQSGFFTRFQEFAGRFGVEQRGIERVLPEERNDTSVSKVGTLVRTTFTAGEMDKTRPPQTRYMPPF